MASATTPEGGAAPEGGEVFAFQVKCRAFCVRRLWIARRLCDHNMIPPMSRGS